MSTQPGHFPHDPAVMAAWVAQVQADVAEMAESVATPEHWIVLD